MWGNLSSVVGNALEKVQQMQSELENQMDTAVGKEVDDKDLGATAVPTAEVAPAKESDISPTVEAQSASQVSLKQSAEKDVDTGSSKQPSAPKKGSKSSGTRKAKGQSVVSNTSEGTLAMDSVDSVASNTESSQRLLQTEINAAHQRIAELTAQYETRIQEQEALHQRKEEEWGKAQEDYKVKNQQHKSAQEQLKKQMEDLRVELVKDNEAALQAAVDAVNKEKERLLKDQEDVFAHEQNGLLERLKELEAENATKLASQKSEYEGKLNFLQTQLSAREGAAGDGNQQVEVVTAEFKRQIDALNDSLQQKDKILVEKDNHSKKLERTNADVLGKLKQQLTGMQDEIKEKDAQLLKLQTDLKSKREEDSTSVDKMHSEISELRASLRAKEDQIERHDAAMESVKAENVALIADVAKLKEALADRERALETATTNLGNLHKEQQSSAQKISDFAAEIAAKDAAIRQSQSSSADEQELQKQIVKYQEQLRQKSETLEAFEKEGQNLARKQSEMEKVVRKSKADLKAKDAEIQKLKESKEQLVKAVEQTQDVLKKHESDATSASKSLSAMQAVSQASTDKLAKLEAELTAKSDELASQRRALEGSWTEATELKRTISELKADRDDLRKRIGEGTSKVMETESSRRDIEQREAVLRATSKQLQESLQRQMHEATSREERLRDECNEMRKRWQEAVGGRESMASELGNATAPLLRQISSLQESMRTKSEHWQTVESSLSERALRAENVAEVAEHKRSLMEEQMLALKQQYTTANSKLQESQTQLQTTQAAMERIKRREESWAEEKNDIDSKFAMEVAQRQSLQSSLRELELRQKVELQEQQERAAVVLAQHELEISKWSKDCDALREELNEARANISAFNGNAMATPYSTKKFSGGNLNANSKYSSGSGRSGPGGSPVFMSNGGGGGGTSDSTSSLHDPHGVGYNFSDVDLHEAAERPDLMPGSLPNGEVSFAITEKIQQRNRQRDDDLESLNLQLQQVQASRNALLDEVSYLSNRNAELEEQCVNMPEVRGRLESSQKQVDLLLVLLGEKEEELEANLADMKEVKNMYRSHINELLEQVGLPSEAEAAAASSAAEAGVNTNTRDVVGSKIASTGTTGSSADNAAENAAENSVSESKSNSTGGR